MKKYLIILLMAVLPTLALAQQAGQHITRPGKPATTTPKPPKKKSSNASPPKRSSYQTQSNITPIEKWQKDNAEAINAVNRGEVVQIFVTSYDKKTPLFNAKNFQSKVTTRYVVYLDKKGVVYAFNKLTDTYFVVYAGADKATDFGFWDTERDILNIRTANGGRLQYDLVNHTLRSYGAQRNTGGD
jgi:hypothetical protein